MKKNYDLLKTAAEIIITKDEEEKRNKKAEQKRLEFSGTYALYETQIAMLRHRLKMSESYDRSFWTRFSIGQSIKEQGDYVPKNERLAVVDEIEQCQEKLRKLIQDYSKIDN